MLSIISLQIFVRNCLFKYQNRLKYIDKINVKVGSKTLSINELKDVFFLFSLIINKSSGVAGINSMLLKKCFGLLCKTLIYLFQLYF